jgi:hypothetical protein
LRRKEGEGNFWIFALILPFSLYILALIFYSKVFSAANFVLLPSKILFLQPLWLLFLFRGKTDFQLWNKTGFVLLITFNLISLVNYHKGSQFLNPKYLVPWRQLANEITANAQKNDIIVTDEETLLFYLRGKPVKGYGLVGAFEYINEQITPFTIYLVLRHRGEESIYQEGCKLKELLAQKYGIPAFRGVMPLKGGEKALWNKISHSDFVYYIEIYSYKVINQIK